MLQAEFSLDFFWEGETALLQNIRENIDLVVIIKNEQTKHENFFKVL